MTPSRVTGVTDGVDAPLYNVVSYVVFFGFVKECNRSKFRQYCTNDYIRRRMVWEGGSREAPPYPDCADPSGQNYEHA